MKRKKRYNNKPYNPSHYKFYSRTTTIPVEIVKLEDNSYHMVVAVEIDGVKGDMIIDTGASVTVVDRKRFADKVCDETVMKMQSGSVTGQINDVQLVKASRFKIGNRRVKNMSLASIDLAYVNDMYDQHLKRQIIGLLGCDFCVRYKAVINYQNKELTLNL